MPAALSLVRAWRMIENAGGYSRAPHPQRRECTELASASAAPAGLRSASPPRPRCDAQPPARARGCRRTENSATAVVFMPGGEYCRGSLDEDRSETVAPALCRTDPWRMPDRLAPALRDMRPICAIQRRCSRQRPNERGLGIAEAAGNRANRPPTPRHILAARREKRSSWPRSSEKSAVAAISARAAAGVRTGRSVRPPVRHRAW